MEQKLMMSNSSRERCADVTHMLRQELLMAVRETMLSRVLRVIVFTRV